MGQATSTARNEIRLLMKERRISQKKLALRIGLSQSYLSRLLAGKAPLKQEHLVKIARALEVEVSLFPEYRAQAQLLAIQNSSQQGACKERPHQASHYRLKLRRGPLMRL